jgi:hypothetical protein
VGEEQAGRAGPDDADLGSLPDRHGAPSVTFCVRP